MTDLTEKTLATERKYTGKIISVDLLDIPHQPQEAPPEVFGKAQRLAGGWIDEDVD